MLHKKTFGAFNEKPHLTEKHFLIGFFEVPDKLFGWL